MYLWSIRRSMRDAGYFQVGIHEISPLMVPEALRVEVEGGVMETPMLAPGNLGIGRLKLGDIPQPEETVRVNWMFPFKSALILLKRNTSTSLPSVLQELE